MPFKQALPRSVSAAIWGMVIAKTSSSLPAPGEIRKRRSVFDAKISEVVPAPEIMRNNEEASALLLEVHHPHKHPMM